MVDELSSPVDVSSPVEVEATAGSFQLVKENVLMGRILGTLEKKACGVILFMGSFL